MPSLWVADGKTSGVYVGDQLASAVYRGTQKIWPPELVREYVTLAFNFEDNGPSGPDLSAQTGLPKNLTALPGGWVDRMYSSGILRVINSPRVIEPSGAGNYRSGNCYKKTLVKTGTPAPLAGYTGVYPFALSNQWFNLKMNSLPTDFYSGTGIGGALRVHSSNDYALFFKLKASSWVIYAGTAGASASTDANIIASGSFNSSTWGGVLPAAGDWLYGYVASHADGTDHIGFAFYKDSGDNRIYPPPLSTLNWFHQYAGDAHPQKSLIRYSGYASGTGGGMLMTNDSAGQVRCFTHGGTYTSYRDVEGD